MKQKPKPTRVRRKAVMVRLSPAEYGHVEVLQETMDPNGERLSKSEVVRRCVAMRAETEAMLAKGDPK